METLEKKITIAEVVGKPAGGVISCVLNFYRHIDREKFKFVFFTYEESRYDDEIKALGGDVVYFPKVTRNVIGSTMCLSKLFRIGHYDIVHVHMTSLSVFPLFAAKRAGINVRICHAHSTANFKEKVYVFKSLLRPLAKVFATDLAGCSEYANLWLYGKRNAFLLHNAIDAERFSTFEQNSRNIIGTVGRLVEQKNYKFLIDVFANVYEKNSDVRLLILGEGKQKKKLEKNIARKGLTAAVSILAERADVEKFYDGISLFVLPSLFEGLPLVAIEAQAKGLPCLLSDRITREADIGGNIKFLPIDKKIWTEEVISALSLAQRKAIRLPSEYDIKAEAKRLERYYEECLCRQNGE